MDAGFCEERPDCRSVPNIVLILADDMGFSDAGCYGGEKYLNPDFYETGRCCSDNNTLFQGNDWDLNRWTPPLDSEGNVDEQVVGARRPMKDQPGYEDCTQRFGSTHTAGMHFVLCDGSVHTISYDIDMKVFSCLGNRKDQEACDDPF